MRCVGIGSALWRFGDTTFKALCRELAVHCLLLECQLLELKDGDARVRNAVTWVKLGVVTTRNNQV